MKKVEIDRNWREVDILDGKDLQNNEQIRVKWPNGKTTIHSIIIERSDFDTYEQGGHRFRIQVSKAFIEVKHKKVNARIRLAQEDLLCERI